MENSKSSDETPKKIEGKAQNTSFDAADLTIRNRVREYSDALSNMGSQSTKQKDSLLAQLCREVENLQSQLRNAEQMFGSGDEMVSVLKEALASAECRKETRRIELDTEEEGESKASGNVTPMPITQKQDRKKDGGIDAEWLLLWLAFRHSRQNISQFTPYPNLATKF